MAEKIMEAWKIDIFFNDFRRWGLIPRLKLEISVMPRAKSKKSKFWRINHF
jgi:hypothetical protein